MKDTAILEENAVESFEAPPETAVDHKTILLFSDDLDRALAAFVIANGAAAMDSEVTIFFAFWGINVLRKAVSAPPQKDLMGRLFGWMMPKGSQRLKLSKMHMFGLGTSMMKRVMKEKHVQMLPDLIATAREAGVRFIVCSMSMDVMGVTRDELMDGVEVAGVGSFLGAADGSNMTLFV